jgi:hypothetical protein
MPLGYVQHIDVNASFYQPRYWQRRVAFRNGQFHKKHGYSFSKHLREIEDARELE